MIKVFSSKSQKIGLIGENISLNFLIENGYKKIDRNINTEYGEIDICVNKNDVYYFFEVKTSILGSKVSSVENITNKKLDKFKKSIKTYTKLNFIDKYKIGFIFVTLDLKNNLYKINYLIGE